MPFGYLFATSLIATGTLLALAPRRPSRTSVSNLSFWLGFLVNELPFVAFYLLAASTLLALGQGDLDTPVGWAGFAVAVLATGGLAVIARRALQARPALETALRQGLGADWRTELDSGLAARLRKRLPWSRIVFGPFFFRRRDVERVSNVEYGDAGRRNLLDVYRHRSRPARAPVLIHFHGGAFRTGKKSRHARPLLYRLAGQGWVCISANYRLRPATFPDPVIDVKKVIAWVRENAHEYGADPKMVFVAGTSAGAHLASIAALTANDATFQPGFEDADTSVSAAIALNGYYGRIETKGLPSSPVAYVRADAPPFIVVHGDHDTIVLIDDARAFVEKLRSASSSPVVYAELPGAQHSFDLFHSIRFESVVDAIEAFAAHVRSRNDRQ